MTEAKPVQFTRNLDLSERRAIERRLEELVPYEEEAKALRRRLVNVKRRLGVESTSRVVERSIIRLLRENNNRMPRHLIIRDLEVDPELVKSALERLRKNGALSNPERGYWVLNQTSSAAAAVWATSST
jgi:hypothetical protein